MIASSNFRDENKRLPWSFSSTSLRFAVAAYMCLLISMNFSMWLNCSCYAQIWKFIIFFVEHFYCDSNRATFFLTVHFLCNSYRVYVHPLCWSTSSSSLLFVYTFQNLLCMFFFLSLLLCWTEHLKQTLIHKPIQCLLIWDYQRIFTRYFNEMIDINVSINFSRFYCFIKEISQFSILCFW